MLQRKGFAQMVTCDHLSNTLVCTIRFAQIGGSFVRCEWLGQNVQCAVPTTGCATDIQRCDCFGEHHSARMRRTFPIGVGEPGSVG